MPDAEFIALCGSGTAERLERALADSANVEARDEIGWTALIHAAGNGAPRLLAMPNAF